MDQGVLVLVLCLVVLGSAVVQAVSGFGYALFSAPILTVLTDGPVAVSTILITGTACDVAILGLRRRRPAPAGREVLRLASWSVPGMVGGAALLAGLSQTALQVTVAVVVVLAVGLRALPSRRRVGDPVSAAWGAPAGLASGALSTATSLGGPPTVLYLSARRLAPAVMRDTLVLLSLARLPLGVATLALAGVWHVHPSWPALVVMALVGQAAGSVVFSRMAERRYEPLVLVLLVASALGAVATTVVPS